MKKIALFLSVSLLFAACSQPPVTTEPETNESDETLQQSLIIKGSDTEVQLVSNLAEAFSEDHPGNEIAVTGGGSATGIASLLNGEIDIANSSRQMSEEEKTIAKDKAITVHEFVLATDGLSVIVHPDNPVKDLTVAQIGDIFSGKVSNWKEVGGPDAPIVLYGRQSTSGTYKFFRDTVVKADYSPQMRNMEGSQAIVDGVKNDVNGIGYAGVGYVKGEDGEPRTDIGILLVKADSDAEGVSPLDEGAVKSGAYPIARSIYQYVAVTPDTKQALTDFLTFEMSEEGEEILEDAGFYTISAEARTANTQLLSDL